MACFFDWPDCFLLASGQRRRPPSFLASQLPFLTSSLRRQVRVVRSYQSSSHLLRRLLASKLQQVPDRSGHCPTSAASARSQWALPGLNSKCQIARSQWAVSGPTAIARSQWALPHLSRKCQIAVGATRPQQQVPDRQIAVGSRGPPQSPDRSGHCPTSAASARSQWAVYRASARSPDRSGQSRGPPQSPDRSGHCPTSAASARSQWALPGLNSKRQIARSQWAASGLTAIARSQWALPDLNSKRQITND